MRILAPLMMALVLAGCATTKEPPVLVRKGVAVDVPPQFLTCRGIEWPDPTTLTDKQVARLLERLSSANSECRANMAAIRKFLAEAKARFG